MCSATLGTQSHRCATVWIVATMFTIMPRHADQGRKSPVVTGAIPDFEVFRECLIAGFDEVLAPVD